MIKKNRQRIEPTDDWQQLDLLIGFPEQRIYELCRPPPAIAGTRLFGRSVAERARQTATPQRTLYRQVDRFEREGMRSLFGPEKVEKHRRLPEKLRSAILELKAEHPDLRSHEIKTICWVRFGHSLSHHTVKRILAEGPVPERKRRRSSPTTASLTPTTAGTPSLRSTRRDGTSSPSQGTWAWTGTRCTTS